MTGTTDEGQKIRAFYTREQEADGVRSFMNVNMLCSYSHMVTFGRIDKERVKNKGLEMWRLRGSGRVKKVGHGRKRQRDG